MQSTAYSRVTAALTWEALSSKVPPLSSAAHRALYAGIPFSAHSNLRLFDQPESAVQVTLYRDVFAWCPYCEKVMYLG